MIFGGAAMASASSNQRPEASLAALKRPAERRRMAAWCQPAFRNSIDRLASASWPAAAIARMSES